MAASTALWSATAMVLTGLLVLLLLPNALSNNPLVLIALPTALIAAAIVGRLTLAVLPIDSCDEDPIPADSSGPPSPIARLGWTAIFGISGSILVWLAMRFDAVPFGILGMVLLAMAAYAFVFALLAFLKERDPGLEAELDRPYGTPPPSSEPSPKKWKAMLPLWFAIGSLASYALALRVYLDPFTALVAGKSLTTFVLQPIYQRFGTQGILAFYLSLGSLCALCLVWMLWRTRRPFPAASGRVQKARE